MLSFDVIQANLNAQYSSVKMNVTMRCEANDSFVIRLNCTFVWGDACRQFLLKKTAVVS